MFISIFIEIVIAALLVASLIPLVREQIWWLRAWTYARLQVFWLTVILATVYFVMNGVNPVKGALLLFAVIVILGLCLRDILPFMPFAPKQTRRAPPGEPGHTITLLAANVLQDNEDAEGLLDTIQTEQPNVVFLVETNAAWKARMSTIETAYPHTHLLALEDYNGMLLYSRYPIENLQVRYLVQDHIPSITADLRISETQTIRFYGLHPRPPRPQDDTADLDSELLFVANEAAHSTDPIIVTGDLNDVGWSSTTKQFLRTSGLLDPRKGRGLFNSYNAKIPVVRWPLDHIFHSEHFSLRAIKRLPAFGSDHFPIYVSFNLMGVEYDNETGEA